MTFVLISLHVHDEAQYSQKILIVKVILRYNILMPIKELTLSIMPVAPEDHIRPILNQFEDAKNISINLITIDWVNYRSRLVDIAVHNRGADISAITVPSTSDMIGMNALRPYTQAEIAELGGPASFLKGSWHSVIGGDEKQAWAIPWIVDSRYIFYWPELLQQAGIDEATAFTSSQQIAATFHKLRDSGLAMPFAAPVEAYQILHAVCSYIWEAGEDVTTPDGTEVTFHHPAAMEAIRAYFDLTRQLPAAAFGIEGQQAFFRKEAAFTISGAWFLLLYPEARVSCVGVPGGSYLGGTNLAIWKHTPYPREAFELVKWLSRPEIQCQLALEQGFLPSRMSVLTNPDMLNHPIYGPRLRGMQSGRTFPCVPMIGLIEDRLSQELARIHRELPYRPGQDTGEVVRSIIEPLGRRLNMALSTNRTAP